LLFSGEKLRQIAKGGSGEMEGSIHRDSKEWETPNRHRVKVQ
jgi:hypothetical protein